MDLATSPSEDRSLIISEMLLSCCTYLKHWTKDVVLKLSGATDSD